MSRADRNRHAVNRRASRRNSSNNSGCAIFLFGAPVALLVLAGWLTGGVL